MALSKTMVDDAGVTLRYHRIYRVDQITNVATRIEVKGYPSRSARESEAEDLAAGRHPRAYAKQTVYEVEWQDMTVDGAYAYLKTLEEYDGAADVLEEDEEG